MNPTNLSRRVIQLYIGLLIYGLASALQIESGLGVDPWDVFHQGVAEWLGISIGLVVIGVGGLVLLAWIPLRQRPGLGTISNVILIGLSLDASMALLPTPTNPVAQWAYLAAGIVIAGMATGLYIGAHFGPGPRDGLMVGFSRRSSHSIRVTRTLIEVAVLAVGWLLGGVVGIGTILYAALIGPLAQYFLRVFDAPPAVGRIASRKPVSTTIAVAPAAA